jgi:hypothetical protein
MGNLGGSFNAFNMLGGRDSYPNVLGNMKPAMETPLPPFCKFFFEPAQGMSQPQGYNIHANSKHYFPKDAEFLSNDAMSKPGAKFTSNRNAVLIKDEKPSTEDPKLEEVDPLNKVEKETEAIRE